MSELPQGILDLIKDIGEKTTLLKLYLLVKDTRWNAYQSLSDNGYDIILINDLWDRQIKIKVKVRERTSIKSGQFLFQVTKEEFICCDYLIGYWFDRNLFFIIPIKELNKMTNKGKEMYYIRILEKYDNEQLFEHYQEYLGRWDLITSSFMQEIQELK